MGAENLNLDGEGSETLNRWSKFLEEQDRTRPPIRKIPTVEAANSPDAGNVSSVEHVQPQVGVAACHQQVEMLTVDAV